MNPTCQERYRKEAHGSGMRRLELSSLQRALASAQKPGVISLALGLPAPELLPAVEIEDAAESLLSEGIACSPSEWPEVALREQIADLMKHRGICCSCDEILLTTGAQQALELIVRLLVIPSRNTILSEKMVYPGFQLVAKHHCGKFATLQNDEYGVDVSMMRSLLRKGLRPACLYTMSVGHNPLGISTTSARQQELLSVAAEYDIPVVEDDVYGFLQYEDKLVEPLRAFPYKHSFYIGSFSKILAPALRIGWIIAERPSIKALSHMKEAFDSNLATFSQRVAARYIQRYSLLQRIGRLRTCYKSRRDAMERALHNYFPPGTVWRKTSAGFFLWVENAGFADTASMLDRAIALGVSFVPGEAFSVIGEKECRSAIRLSFSHCPPEFIGRAVGMLAEVVAEKAYATRANNTC